MDGSVPAYFRVPERIACPEVVGGEDEVAPTVVDAPSEDAHGIDGVHVEDVVYSVAVGCEGVGHPDVVPALEFDGADDAGVGGEAAQDAFGPEDEGVLFAVCAGYVHPDHWLGG